MTPDLLPASLIYALGWTLVHSLWQACCIALALSWALSRYSQPRIRYRAAYSGLVVVLAAALLTFLWLYEPGTARAVDVETGYNPFVFSAFLSDDTLPTSIWKDAIPALEARYPYLVLGWAVGCAALLLRFLGAFWWVHRLRHRGLSAVSAIWQQRFEVLARRMGMGVGVRLFESAWICVPVAIGHLKPLVLLPVGLLNQLSPAEVEAVLAHELAHIARRDWLFNLLQSLIESLFYYHPAIWWMSGIARREREACCDEQAVAQCGNPIHYAKVLVRVQELATPLHANQLVLGLDGGGPVAVPAARRRMRLLERVRRILHPPQHTSHNMEKTIATVGLLALLLFVGIRANTSQGIGSAFAQSTPFWGDFFSQNTEGQFVGDSLPRPKMKQRISREEDGQRVEAEYEGGKVTRLTIDGKEIPAAEFSHHRALTEELLREMAPPPPPPAPPGVPAPRRAPDVPDFYPPVPPTPPVPPRLTRVKNADGSIVLHIENAEGKPVEIRVQNGETWVDGKKLPEGESFDLPELGGSYAPEIHFFEGGWPAPDPESEAELTDTPPEMEDRKNAHSDAMRQHREILIEHRRIMENTQRELRQQQQEIHKEIKEQQKQIEIELKNSRHQQQLALLRGHEQAMRQWQQEEEARHDEAVAYWGHQLLRDGLIADPAHYSIVLTAKKMTVNGKKQSAEVYQKYRKLYEQRTGGPLTGNNKFSIDVK